MLLNNNLSNDILSIIPSDAMVDLFGIYKLDFSRIDSWKENTNCHIAKVCSQTQVGELVDLEIDEYGEKYGKDFCERSTQYFGDIYLSDFGVNAYIAYLFDEVVGKCQLLIDGSIAKIEYLDIKKTARNKKIATTLLKKVATIAMQQGATTIYLVADENDTPKEMYGKMGFSKVGYWTDIFWTSKK